MSFFLDAQNVGITQPASGFLSEGINVCVALCSVHLCEEGNSGSLFFAIFLTTPDSIYFMIPFKSIQRQAKIIFGKRLKQWLPLELLAKRGSKEAFQNVENILYPWWLQRCGHK